MQDPGASGSDAEESRLGGNGRGGAPRFAADEEELYDDVAGESEAEEALPEEGGGPGGGPPGDADAGVLREQLLRLAAEFDNYRKRESRERTEAWARAKADLIEKLLEPVEDLSRVAHPESDAGGVAEGLLVGVALVERKLLQVLEREGLQRIDAEGAAFDPAIHDAILTQPTSRPELDGRVAHVAIAGYRFGDRLLRPAKVVVWKLRE